MPSNPTIHIRTEGVCHELYFERAAIGKPISDLLAQRGFALNTRCGGRGLCAGCEVRLVSGMVTECASGSHVKAPGDIRTCQHTIESGEVMLAIPERALLKHKPAVVADFRINIPRGLDPLRAGCTHGAAVDIGTTTVALMLIDLRSGEVVGKASAFNAQVRFGEDVLTRIGACSTDHTQAGMMQRAVSTETIQPLLEQACQEAGVDTSEVGVMSVAGNTTMLHLLAGVDPTPLGVHPFAPVFTEHKTHAPTELGMKFGDPDSVVHLLPGAAAYVGADITAGVVASGMLYDDKPTLLVDVGTNGEIVIKVGNRLLGCATAAGPAFEGAGLFSGVRAVTGAIERLGLSADPFSINASTIGAARRPIGICGSAYVDFLANARAAGYLGSSGRFTDALAAEPNATIETGTYGRRLLIASNGASGNIYISELDVARLLQAKAAIAAGVEILLKLVDCSAKDIERLYLAGGFGMHLSLEHAIGCGLLPGFRTEQIQVVGNTSLAGAMLVLTEKDLLEETKHACEVMEEIELNLQPGFEDAYIDNLTLKDPKTKVST